MPPLGGHMTFAKFLLSALVLNFAMSGSALSADSLLAVHMLFTQNASSQQQLRLIIGDNRVATLDGSDAVLSLFDAGSSQLYTLDHANASYRVSDVESVLQLAAKIEAGMAAFESKIATLPASEQASARKKLQAFFPQRQQIAGETDFVSTDETGSFADVSCEWFETVIDGTKTGRICATAPDNMPGGPTLHSMLSSISTMYETMKKANLGSITLPLPANPMAPVASLGLIPLKMEEYETAESAMVDVELVSVKRQLTKRSLLQLPPGYKVQASPAASTSLTGK